VPPAQYAFWWAMTAQCSGLSADMSTIQWYVVPSAGDLGPDVDGLYYPKTHRIVLLADSVSSGQLVRHEMLHALGAEPGHPAKYFQDGCGGVVDCFAACVKDGGGRAAVDSAGPVVDPKLLEITASLDPGIPTAGDSSWAALTVRVFNPYPYAIRVGLTQIFNTPASETFGYTISSCNFGQFYNAPVYDYVFGNRLVLGAYETRKRVFDIRDWSCSRGIVAWFNSDTVFNKVVVPIKSASHTSRDR